MTESDGKPSGSSSSEMSIDAAWAEVRTALPEGWAFEVAQYGDHCEAVALDAWRERQLLTWAADPPTALRALVLQLRELH